ncbi:unnamed protein product [Brassica oleracea var. botrytis]|uniref:Uncharacterized protein n=2 Tax=Brassica TaxID=3705 RepID=A0A3P6G147_BRAOL|nr:unnamed protein product [Brassica napus]VDD51355.1 unnamed protein product [Brassica oleracea]
MKKNCSKLKREYSKKDKRRKNHEERDERWCSKKEVGSEKRECHERGNTHRLKRKRVRSISVLSTHKWYDTSALFPIMGCFQIWASIWGNILNLSKMRSFIS